MTKLLSFALLAITLNSLPKGIQQKVDSLYEEMGKPRFKTVADSLSPQEASSITSCLRDYVGDPANWDKIAQTDLLIELGDDETIAKEAKTFPERTSGGRSFFMESIQPKVLTYLAPTVFKNEGYVLSGGGDTGPVAPVSFQASEAIRRVLSLSPYFSPSVNAWAASWQFGQSPVRFRKVLRDWWNANRLLISSGNYTTVEPGEPPPAKADATPARFIPTFPAFPKPSPSETVESRPSPLPAPEVSSGSTELEIAIGLLGCLTLLLILFMRKKLR